MEAVSYIATVATVTAYWLNIKSKWRTAAAWVWIVGDVLWIIWDIAIANWSHLVLCAIIVVANLVVVLESFRNVNSSIRSPEKE